MANYASLKNIIDQYITTNGQGDITGAILNDVLKSIVNSIGADFLFAGVAEPTTNPGSPDQNVFYIAIKGGTYTNFGNVVIPNGITIFKWNGSWSNQILFAGDGGVFDISAYHATGGTLATYADLSSALDSNNGGGVPPSLQKGGMSVKFVGSSDNKYVQYFLTKNVWSASEADWEKMNLEEEISQLGGGNKSLSVDNWEHATIQQSLYIQTSENYRTSPAIFMANGDVMKVNTSGINPLWTIIKCSQDGTPISGLVALNGDNDTIATYTYQATEDMYVRVSVRIVLPGYSVTHQSDGEIGRLDKKIDGKIIRLTGFGYSGEQGGAVNDGDIFYNTRTRLLRKKVSENNYETIPFDEAALYTCNGGIFVWNGADLVPSFDALNIPEKNVHIVWINGEWNNNGVISQASGFHRSDYISVFGARELNVVCDSSSSSCGFFDGGKKQILGFSVATGSNLIPIPDNAAYVVLSGLESFNPAVTISGVKELGTKLVKLVGFGSSGSAAGVTQKGEIFFNTTTRLIRKKVGDGDTAADYTTIPFYDGAIYTYNNNLYIWNGLDFVQKTYNISPESIGKNIEGIVDTIGWENKIMSFNAPSSIVVSNNQNYRLSSILFVKKGSVIYVNTSAGSSNIVLVASCNSDGSNLRGLVITDSDVSSENNKRYRCEIMEDSYIRVGYRFVLNGSFVSILKAEDNLLFAETKQETPKHIRILLMGNSYTSDAWGYVPFLLKQYGITCEIYMYWRGALSLDDLVRFWESSDQYDATSPQAAEGAYRFLYYIDTRYDNSWKELSRMSAKDLVALGGWNIIQIQQWGRYSMDNSHTNPYFEQVMSLIRESYSSPYTLAWEMAWLRVVDLSQTNKDANLSVAEIINKEHCADIVFPCATTIFNCQENPTLAAIGDSEYHNLFSFDNVHLEEGLPVYAAGCAIAEVLLRRYYPVVSILGNTLRPTATDVANWNIPQRQMPQSGVITSITDDNCYLAQKAAIIANKYPYEINGV